jgi:hypothetical protein
MQLGGPKFSVSDSRIWVCVLGLGLRARWRVLTDALDEHAPDLRPSERSVNRRRQYARGRAARELAG